MDIDLQIACQEPEKVPSLEQLTLWAKKAMQDDEPHEITIRIVDETESQMLNSIYRGKDYPTNVLSFPFECPAEVALPLLGDLVICQQVMQREAAEQGISEESHWAHLVVHGCLHLQGFDHIEDDEAEEMESLETQILQSLGYADPYASEKTR